MPIPDSTWQQTPEGQQWLELYKAGAPKHTEFDAILEKPNVTLAELAGVFNACKKLKFPTRLTEHLVAARKDARNLVQQKNVRESTKIQGLKSYVREHINAHQSNLREQRLKQLNALKDAAIKRCRQ